MSGFHVAVVTLRLRMLDRCGHRPVDAAVWFYRIAVRKKKVVEGRVGFLVGLVALEK